MYSIRNNNSITGLLNRIHEGVAVNDELEQKIKKAEEKINNQNKDMNNLKLAADQVKLNQIQKFADVALDLQKNRVLNPVRSVIKNIENANIPFYTTNNSHMNDSISKTRLVYQKLYLQSLLRFLFIQVVK